MHSRLPCIQRDVGGSCWRSAGVCERAAQRSRSIRRGCETTGNNHGTFTMKVVKSVFVLLAMRGHNILYSDRLGGEDTP